MEPRIIQIEYETEDNRNNLGISVLSLREDDLKTISISTSCCARISFTREEIMKALTHWQRTAEFRPKEDPRHDNVYQRLEALEKFQKHIERQMQACLKDLNGGMQPGDKISISSRVMELERNKADAGTLSGRAGDKLRGDFRELAKLFCNLENSVKTLEDQHREKYVCVGFDSTYGRLYYMPKPETG